MLGIIFSFPFLYLLSGFKYEKSPINYDLAFKFNIPEFWPDYWKAFDISLYSFTFQKNLPYVLNFCSKKISILESAISATLITLFLLAIKRYFKR